MPPLIDLQPTLWLFIFLLICLALFMPFTGGRAARRREAWERFDNLARIKGLLQVDRESLTRWARVAIPDVPHNVLVRRKDFDRYARSEVQRLRGLDREAFSFRLARLGALRRSLSFDRSPGLAQSSHDLRVGELLDLRQDDSARHLLRVVRTDEEGLHVSPVTRAGGRAPQGPGWATFTRDGEGSYRFRTAPLRPNVFDHGEFLVLEERRRDPRVTLDSPPFWVAVECLPDGAAPEDPEGVEVEAMDVSSGGLALLADRRVRRGSEISLDLPLGDGEGGPMLRNLRAQVLNCGYREGGGRRPHFLHCALVGADEPQRKVLEAFVRERVEQQSPDDD